MINIVFVSAEPKLDKIFVNSLKSASFFNMNMTASFVDKSLDRTEVSISFVFAPNLTQHLSPPQRPLYIVGRLLCCGEAGEKEKESAQGAMALPIVPRALSIFVHYWYFDGDTQGEPLRRRETQHCLLYATINQRSFSYRLWYQFHVIRWYAFHHFF